MAKETIGELFRRGDYYLVKRIREVIGQMKGTGFGPETEYMITLYDSSKGRLEYFDTDDDGSEAVGLTFDDGDIVTIPPNTIVSGLEMSDQAANFPAVSVAGISRLNSSFQSNDETTVTPSASWENITFDNNHSGNNPQYGITSWKGGTSYIFNTTVDCYHQTGSGNLSGIRAYDSGAGVAIVNIYGSKVIVLNDGTGEGWACSAEDGCTINFYNCHLQVKDQTDPHYNDGSSFVNYYGCLIEQL